MKRKYLLFFVLLIIVVSCERKNNINSQIEESGKELSTDEPGEKVSSIEPGNNIKAVEDLITQYGVKKYLYSGETENPAFLREQSKYIDDYIIRDFNADGYGDLYVIYYFVDQEEYNCDECYLSADALYIKSHKKWVLTDIGFSKYHPGGIMKNLKPYIIIDNEAIDDTYMQEFDKFLNNILFIKEDGNNPAIGIYYIKDNRIHYGINFTYHGYIIAEKDNIEKIYYVNEDFALWSYPIPSTENIKHNCYKKYLYTIQNKTGGFSEYKNLTPYLFDTLYQYKRKSFLETGDLFEFFDLYWYCYYNNKKILSKDWIDSHAANVQKACPGVFTSLTRLLKQRLVLGDSDFFKLIDSWSFFEDLLCGCFK